jgi:hypothetical protein
MLRSMELSTVGTALEILNKAWKGLEAVRERAQASKDAALKSGVGTLYDDFNSLKSAIVRLTDENAKLRQTISEGAEKPPKPEIRQTGKANYYYVGSEGPYCQPCYDVNKRLVNLTPQQRYAGGVGRKCHVCDNLFIEEAAQPGRAQIKMYRG